MKQIPYKSQYNLAICALHISLLAIAFMFVGCEKIDVMSHEVDGFKVGMLLPGSTDDKGWNALAYDALLAIEEELDATISPVESHTPAKHEADVRSLATEGYNLIFGHGYEYGAPIKIVAPDFPETVFVISSGDVIAENIASINFQVEPATHLLGIIAGMMTKTEKIGVIGGQDFPAVISAFDAFEAGVKSVNPDAAVRRDYVGNWEDVAKGKELAIAQINEGIDFIFPNADIASRGVFMAAEEAHTAGNIVYTFGANRDQSAVSPTTVIANAVITPRPFVEIAQRVKEGTFTPQIYTYTMSTDRAIDMVYNPALINKVPEAVKTKVAEAKAEILSGKLFD